MRASPSANRKPELDAQRRSWPTAQRTWAWLAAALLVLGCAGCAPGGAGQQTILIGLTPTAAAAVQSPKQPDPLRTGITSLDLLNRAWQVQQMIPLFPDVSPADAAAVRQGLAGIYKLVVPAQANLELMVRAYRADPNIAYAEINQGVEAK